LTGRAGASGRAPGGARCRRDRGAARRDRAGAPGQAGTADPPRDAAVRAL